MKRQAFICDIDGTLALRGNRDPYDMTRVSEDLVNEPVAIVVRALTRSDFEAIFTSGRSEKARDATIAWIRKVTGVYTFVLMMRAAGDGRSDAIVKREMLDTISKQYEIKLVIDDRNSVVDMWRSNGLTCFQVAPGDF